MSRFFRSVGDSDTDSSSSEEELMSSGDEEEKAKPAPSRPAGGMSRFLRTAGSDSSSSEDSDDDSDSDDDEEDGVEKKRKSKYGFGSGGEDSEGETKRVVKSAKDKRFDEMEAATKAMENAQKINNWVAITAEFDKLNRLVQRQTNAAERIPGLFLKTIAVLEAAINSSVAKEKEAKKKMNSANYKALMRTRQDIKKAQKEYEQPLKDYQEDPEAYDRREAVPEEVVRPRRAAREPSGQDGVIEDDAFTTVGKGGKSMVFSSETILKNLQVVQEARGKKSTDRLEQIRILEKLLEVASTTYQRVRVLLSLVSSRFDYNPSATYMPLNLWASAQREIDQLVSLAASNTSYSIEEFPPDYDDLKERTPQTEADGVVRIRGSIFSFVDRLDDEFTKSLQNIDPHGTEYVDRLKDEKGLYDTICKCQAFYDKTGQKASLFRVVMRRLEHIYSKPTLVVRALESGHAETPSISSEATSNLVHTLCVTLYKSGNSLLRTRAMLCHIFHHALNNRFHTARDMLLMSHLQENIHAADVPTQILFNRAVVQLGLCAFRSGLIREAQAILLDICATQRVKELLAQGIYHSRFATLTPEQEKAERLRQMPFHMHINTELLEAAFLVCSMLVEIPLIAGIDSDEMKRKAISKPFRRLLDFADRQVFSGPPETTRDHIMQASKALQEGRWEKCRDLIQSIKIWSLMPEEKAVMLMLERRIQEEGLRTYLYTYAPFYTTLSLSLLSRTFSLPVKDVTSIISKMIWSEDLSASLDQSTGVVIFHLLEPSRSQQLAQSIADRVNQMVEQNEKALDLKFGGGTWHERANAQQPSKGAENVRTERSRPSRGAARGGARGIRFAQGLGSSMSSASPRPQTVV